jgi:protein-disulfide isomerase
MTRRWESDGLEPVGTRDHSRGPMDAPVTLVKYGDYECPYCGEAHPMLKELLERVGEQVRFVFRHFPLDSMHPRARRAAQAAEAVGSQGRFWEMHDLLYERQDELGEGGVAERTSPLAHLLDEVCSERRGVNNRTLRRVVNLAVEIAREGR